MMLARDTQHARRRELAALALAFAAEHHGDFAHEAPEELVDAAFYVGAEFLPRRRTEGTR